MSHPRQYDLPCDLDFDLDDGRSLTISITYEGIIMDVYGLQEDETNGMVRDDLHLGTAGLTFDEWADWLVDDKRQRCADIDRKRP